MALDFLSVTAGGVNFAHGILNVHPGIRTLIFAYIDSFYKRRQNVLRATAGRFEEEWKLASQFFFDTVDTLFHNHSWPKGKYVGYISIFNCNPRFIENKTFQVYHKHHAGPLYVAAHELLHFMFYDYVARKRKDVVYKLTEEELWVLSEIVNEALFAVTPLKAFCKGRLVPGYPELKEKVARVKKKLAKRKNALCVDKTIDTVIHLK